MHDDTVACLWMGGEGDLFRETLPLIALESADIDSPDDEEDDEENEEEDEDGDEDHDEKASRKKRKAA